MFPEQFDNNGKVDINVTFNFSFSKDYSVATCTSKYTFKQLDGLLLILELSTLFQIHEDGVSEIKEQGKVSADFLRYMGTIAVGAARGFIAAKTEDCVLNAIVLPPINLMEIIKDDFRYDTVE